MVVYKPYRPLGDQHHYTYPLTMQMHSLVDGVIISIFTATDCGRICVSQVTYLVQNIIKDLFRHFIE